MYTPLIIQGLAHLLLRTVLAVTLALQMLLTPLLTGTLAVQRFVLWLLAKVNSL